MMPLSRDPRLVREHRMAVPPVNAAFLVQSLMCGFRPDYYHLADGTPVRDLTAVTVLAGGEIVVEALR